jgi:hypothetical protein
MTPITIASGSSRAEITAISVYLAYAGRQTDRQNGQTDETETETERNQTYLVLWQRFALRELCNLRIELAVHIGGDRRHTHLSRLSVESTTPKLPKLPQKNFSKLLEAPFFPTGALRCTCRAPRRAFTPPMQPENLLRYRCPKNRAPQRELPTANTTKTTEEGRKGREEESPRNRSRGVTSPRARVQGLWGLCDVSTGAGVDGVPARVYLWAGPISDGWTRQHGRRAVIGWTGVALLCGGTPRQPGRCISSLVVFKANNHIIKLRERERERERDTYGVCHSLFPVSLLQIIH